MKFIATLSILVILLYTWKALGNPVYDDSYIPEKYDAHAFYQPENDAGHVAYNQAKHDDTTVQYNRRNCMIPNYCHRKCTELIAQLEDLKLTHVTSPVLDMEGCMQNCDESNAYGWKR